MNVDLLPVMRKPPNAKQPILGAVIEEKRSVKEMTMERSGDFQGGWSKTKEETNVEGGRRMAGRRGKSRRTGRFRLRGVSFLFYNIFFFFLFPLLSIVVVCRFFRRKGWILGGDARQRGADFII